MYVIFINVIDKNIPSHILEKLSSMEISLFLGNIFFIMYPTGLYLFLFCTNFQEI